MRKFIALCLGVVLALAPIPALAGFTQVSGTGPNGAIIANTFIAGASGTVITTAALQTGDVVAFLLQDGGAGTGRVLSCSDAFGNTWQMASGGAEQSGAANGICFSRLTNAISSGSSITVADSKASFLVAGIAIRPAGTGAFDTNPTPQITSGTTVTVGPTPALACPGGGSNCEVCVAGAIWNNSDNATGDVAFTLITDGPGGGRSFTAGYKFLSSTAALSYTATNPTSASVSGSMACFKDTPVGFTLRNRSLSGVGR